MFWTSNFDESKLQQNCLFLQKPHLIPYLTFFTIDGVANDVMQYKMKENKWERRKIISCWEMIIWLRKLEKEIPRRNTTQKILPDKFWWWGIQKKKDNKYFTKIFLTWKKKTRKKFWLALFYVHTSEMRKVKKNSKDGHEKWGKEEKIKKTRSFIALSRYKCLLGMTCFSHLHWQINIEKIFIH